MSILRIQVQQYLLATQRLCPKGLYVLGNNDIKKMNKAMAPAADVIASATKQKQASGFESAAPI
jgi:hypothetical protein